MTNEQLIIAAKTALILKGKWGTWDEEAIWVNKIFSDLEIGTCTFIVQKLAVSGKIKSKKFDLASDGWFKLPNTTTTIYKTGYDIQTGAEGMKLLSEAIKQFQNDRP